MLPQNIKPNIKKVKSLEKSSSKKIAVGPFLLDEWMDAIERLRINDPRTYEKIEDYANKEWASFIADELEVADQPLDLIKNYLNLISEKGIIIRKDITAEKKGEKIIITVSGDNTSFVRRGKFFSHLIEIANSKIYDFKEIESGNTCKIELSPSVFTLRVGLSYKIGRGSINISEKDLGKLGMDMIENVTLVPYGKDTGIGEMMFSNSKVPRGYVFMNVADATLIGLKEMDKVELIKKESEEKEEETAEEQEKAEKAENTEQEDEKLENPEEEAKEEVKEEEAKEPELETAKGPENEDPEEKTGKKAVKQNLSQEKPQESKPQIKDKQGKPKLQKQAPPKPKAPLKKVADPDKAQIKVDKSKQMKDFESKIDALRNQ
jgi:hypothetical protein